MAFEMRLLGAVALRDGEGIERTSVLRQAKRFALLAYLAVARPAGFERRDRLLALFWPELDEGGARDALNTAVRFLRRELGAETIVSRGDAELGLSPGAFVADVAGFHDAIAQGRFADAMGLYAGDLLDGFHCDASAAFDEWLDRERARLRRDAMNAAGRAVAEAERSGDLAAAVAWARRAVELGDDDEPALRALLAALDRSGDRAAAVREYQAYRARLRAALDVAPSRETRDFAAALFASGELAAPDAGRPPALASRPEAETAAEAGGERLPRAQAGGAPTPSAGMANAATPTAGAVPAAPADRPGRAWGARLAGLLATLAIVGGVATWATLRRPDLAPSADPLPEDTATADVAPQVAPHADPPQPRLHRVAFLPFDTEVGRGEKDDFARLAGTRLQNGVLHVGHSIVDGATVARFADSTRLTGASLFRALARAHGATAVVRGSYAASRDSVWFEAAVFDAASGAALFAVGPEAGPRSDPSAAIVRLRERLLGGLAMGGSSGRVPGQPPRYAAFQVFRQAEQLPPCQCAGPERAAERRAHLALVDSALRLDSTYVDAYVRALGIVEYDWPEYRARLARFSALRPTLSPYDILRLDFAEAVARGDPDQVIRIGERLYAATHSSVWALEVAARAVEALRPRIALTYLARVDSSAFVGGWVERYDLLIRAYHYLGDTARERSTIGLAAAAHPGADLDRYTFPSAVSGRDSSRLMRLVRERASGPLDQVIAFARTRGINLIAELRAHGDTVTMRRVADLMIATMHRVREPDRDQGWYLRTAFMWNNRGNADSARAVLDRRARRFGPRLNGPQTYWRIGGWAARWGDTASALAALDSALRVDPATDRGQARYWAAAINSALGRRAEAVRLLAEARRRGVAASGWHAADAIRELRGYPPFEALLHPSR